MSPAKRYIMSSTGSHHWAEVLFPVLKGQMGKPAVLGGYAIS